MHCASKSASSPLLPVRVLCGAVVFLLCAQGFAADEQGPAKEDKKPQGFEPAIRYGADGKPVDPCRQFDAKQKSWLDRSRVGLYRTVCGTGAWFDGFFGDSRFDEKTGDTYGRLSLGGYFDRRDKFDEIVRLRASFAFPAMRRRGSVFIAQGDEDSFVEERGRESTEQGPEALNDSSDNQLFAGIGLDKLRSLERGLSFRLGVRLHTPIETFVKVRYRNAWHLSENYLFRIRPVVYWRSEERLGSTLGLEFDHNVSDQMLLRWANFGNVSQDPEVNGMRWGSTLALFQALSDRRALTYSAFVRGETEDDVKLQNYGLEVKFRRRFLRKWLFIEYVGSLSWPKELPTEKRELNPGFGIRFEAHFGPTPDHKLR